MIEKNDYMSVFSEIYYPAMKKEGSSADLSGWEYSPLALTPPELTCPLPNPSDLQRYYADSGNRLNSTKEHLIPALEILEGGPVHCDDFTLLPSTTSAIAIVLSYLKDNGIENIVVEAPAYFAVVDAASRMNLNCKILSPLEETEGVYTSDLERIKSIVNMGKTCLWLHQPRYALGCDLSEDLIFELRNSIRDDCYFVLDEANDDNMLLISAGLHQNTNTFRLRSLGKPFGLNGVRASLLMHPRKARDSVTDIMWSVGGALDWFSTSIAKSMTTPPQLYADMLRQMRFRLSKQRMLLKSFLNIDNCTLLSGETGFLGTVRINWKKMPGNDFDKRYAFIHHMAKRRVPAILGAHYYMPKKYGFEHVRVNLLNTPEILKEGVNTIQKFIVRSDHPEVGQQ